MKRFIILSVALMVLAWSAFAQTGTAAQSQTSAGASSNTNVSAGQNGVNAQSDTSINASQNTNAQRSGENKDKKNKQKKDTSSADANSSAAGSASSAGGDAAIATGATLNAVLTKSVDSRKAKEGDEVVAKTTSDLKADGQRTIPKGTKLIGHVTKSSAKAKGDSDSSLGVIFDRAEVAKGREVPIHAVVQAIAATSTAASAGGYDEPTTMAPATPNVGNEGANSGGGGLVGGTVGGVNRTVNNTAGAAGNAAGGAVGSAAGTVNGTAGSLGTSTSSTLNSTASGVVGLPGYTLDTAASNATQGSVITSSGKNVKLDSGTQMVLRVVGQ